MNLSHHRRLPFPSIILAMVFFVAAAGMCADAQAPAEGPGAEPKGWFSTVKEALNPTYECPECGATFSAQRSMWMLLVGFVGQAFFTSRFLVQWIASERRKESYIPIAFWYLSIAGSLMLLAYATSIMAWPIILGQAFGTIVYGRNLALIARKKQAHELESSPDKQD